MSCKERAHNRSMSFFTYYMINDIYEYSVHMNNGLFATCYEMPEWQSDALYRRANRVTQFSPHALATNIKNYRK